MRAACQPVKPHNMITCPRASTFRCQKNPGSATTVVSGSAHHGSILSKCCRIHVQTCSTTLGGALHPASSFVRADMHHNRLIQHTHTHPTHTDTCRTLHAPMARRLFGPVYGGEPPEIYPGHTHRGMTWHCCNSPKRPGSQQRPAPLNSRKAQRLDRLAFARQNPSCFDSISAGGHTYDGCVSPTAKVY